MQIPSLSRRSVALSLMGAGALGAFGVRAQGYPDKPVRFIVPFAAGGGVDNITRAITPFLASRLQQPMLVENKPGANANIGADMVAKAAPDGYTLLMGATFLAFNRATTQRLAYDAQNDLVPVARMGRAPFILAVSANSAFKSVSDLVAHMKAKPAEASYGAVGAGAPAQLLFVRNTGTQPVQVLYKGGAAAMPDLISGRLTFMIQTASEILPQVANGKLRALAVTGTERARALPEVPTMAQAGVADLEGTGWWGVFAPAKTPQPVVDRLSREVLAVLQLPEVIAAFERMGIESAPMSHAEFAPYYREELQRFIDVARAFNLRSE